MKGVACGFNEVARQAAQIADAHQALLADALRLTGMKHSEVIGV